MKALFSKGRRLIYGAVATALTAAVVVPNLLTSSVYAAQVTSRSIEISSSTAGATGVSYQVGFTPATTATTIQAIIVDFCSNDPIIGDSCTAPTGFSVGTPTVTGVTVTGQTGGTWTASSQNTGRTLELANGSSTGTPSGAVTFTLTTATNPNFATCGTPDTHPNCSFYGRILTFATTANATTWLGTANGSANTGFIDYGGVALSTSAVINITAKVMETLSFCVYNATCGDDPSFTIGHAVGSATVIDSSAVDTSNVKFDIATNAQSGAIIRLKGDTLKSGSNSLLAAGAAAQTIANGDTSHQFGVRVSTAGTNITATSPYNAAGYAFDTSTGGENVTTTYGDDFAHLSGPTNSSTSTITFAATAANTTPAGTYTGAEQLIATGTF
ncbi:MAG TPA: hypothetical protein VHD60_00365 [Candidatus Saccharimonadales bacterium]|nr:hypothetical protein [Candidatus Saccharimonadales bacterium]